MKNKSMVATIAVISFVIIQQIPSSALASAAEAACRSDDAQDETVTSLNPLERQYRTRRAIGTVVMTVGALTFGLTPLALITASSFEAWTVHTVVEGSIGLGMISGGSVMMSGNGRRIRAIERTRKKTALNGRMKLTGVAPILHLRSKTVGAGACMSF